MAGGLLHRLAGGTGRVRVNSLHDQGIDRLSARLAVEAVASDGVVEGVRVIDAPGFAAGVQWHPEYDYETDPLSRAIFAAFGGCRACADRRPAAAGGAAHAARAPRPVRGGISILRRAAGCVSPGLRISHGLASLQPQFAPAGGHQAMIVHLCKADD